MKKIIIAALIAFALFSFTEEKKATIIITEAEYNAVQSLLYSIAASSDSLDGSHQAIKRIQNNVITLQNFLKERTGTQFDVDTTKINGSEKPH